MYAAIYISGISGFTLLALCGLNYVLNAELDSLSFISSLVILLGVFLPLSLLDMYQYKRRIRRILKSHKEKPHPSVKLEQGDKKTKGWGMNNSPYRDRKSGLTWGGGNIKGANAKRETRRSFLKY